MAKKEIINDIRSDCPCNNIKYCPLESLVKGFSDRLFEQHKCIEMLRWVISEQENREITEKESCVIWVEKGYAKAFSEIYQDGMLHEEIFKQILQILKK